eukprot:2927399-Prymnesium_polylepis.2
MRLRQQSAAPPDYSTRSASSLGSGPNSLAARNAARPTAISRRGAARCVQISHCAQPCSKSISMPSMVTQPAAAAFVSSGVCASARCRHGCWCADGCGSARAARGAAKRSLAQPLSPPPFPWARSRHLARPIRGVQHDRLQPAQLVGRRAELGGAGHARNEHVEALQRRDARVELRAEFAAKLLRERLRLVRRAVRDEQPPHPELPQRIARRARGAAAAHHERCELGGRRGGARGELALDEDADADQVGVVGGERAVGAAR